jgi:predicted ester cyclase
MPRGPCARPSSGQIPAQPDAGLARSDSITVRIALYPTCSRSAPPSTAKTTFGRIAGSSSLANLIVAIYETDFETVLSLHQPKSDGPRMSDDLDRNKHLVRIHFDALGSGDYAALESIHDPAGRNHAPGPFDLSAWPAEGKPFGPAEVRETFDWLRAAVPDLRVEIEDLVAEGDEVIAWLRMTGTQTGIDVPAPPTGRKIDFHHAHRFRLRDGRIMEHWAVRDDLRAMLQAGVVRPPGRADAND